MANTIRIKSGPSYRFDSIELAIGEFGYVTDTGELYIGNETGGKSLLNFSNGGGGGDGGDASTAETLANPRYFQITGTDASSPAIAFDGSANVSLAMVLASSGVIAGTYTKVTVDGKGRVLSGDDLSATDIPLITLDKISNAGTAASYDVGTNEGEVIALGTDGKIPTSMLSQVVVTTVHVVDSETEMLQITEATTGTLAIRTDEFKTYVLMQLPTNNLSNWQHLLSPTGLVQSVNGDTGTVIINTITGNSGTATKLQTPRTINEVQFDGTQNIVVYDDTKEPAIAASVSTSYWTGLKQFTDFATSVMGSALDNIITTNDTQLQNGDSLIGALGKLQGQLNNTIKSGDIIDGGQW